MEKKYSKHTRDPARHWIKRSLSRNRSTHDSACILRALTPRNRSGLSTIVITVILVALSMAAIVLVWGFVNNMIKKQISSSESCFGNSEKVTLNTQYTCYEEIDSTDYNLRFSLSIGDIQIDKVIISVASAGSVKSYQITNTPQDITNLVMYSGTNPTNIILPGENSGLTYNATGFNDKIDSIQIAPVIGGNLCGVSDSLSEIENCVLMS